MNQTLYPAPLQKGDIIGVMATSCHVARETIVTATNFMEAEGYKVFVHEQTFNQHHQSAGTAQEKVVAMHDLFKNKDIKAIFGARGGNRASTMLDALDYNLIRSNPKILIGYSDLTAPCNAITAKTGLVTFHGPLFRELPTHEDYRFMVDVLEGKQTTLDLKNCTIVKNGAACGKIIGGNLSVLQGLIGSPYQPDFNNAILILEDVADHISRYDRMFCHLRNAGILQNLCALIVGSFSDMKDSDSNPFGFTLKDIVEEHTTGYNYPILMNAPFGHEGVLNTLPIGANATLENSQLSFKAVQS